mmetsp:Transcript_6090/g.12205  ORF Transcript_6090/g.12205 Transcript_6090/m.12205 type:complete len:604 (+) Transcript_6090:297-2108(+)|eukprot:scaffold834_cov172-Amphora_coffeaeformis.AAC.2
MAVPKGRKSFTRHSTKYNGFNNQHSPYHNRHSEYRFCLQRTRYLFLVVGLVVACFLIASPSSSNQDINNKLSGMKQVDRVATEEQSQEHSSDTLSEQSQEGRVDNNYKPVVPAPARIDLSQNIDVHTDYPPPINVDTTSNLDVDETRGALHRVPPFTYPRITFPESLDEPPAHACPNESTSTRSSSQVATLIITLSDDLHLMDRIKNLCTRVWKTDPIVAVVSVPPEASELRVEREIWSMCPHLEVMLYSHDLVDGAGSDYADEDGYYDYYRETSGGEDDDMSPTHSSAQHDNFVRKSLTLAASNDNERGDIDKQNPSLDIESSQGQTHFDRRISGETHAWEDTGRTSFGRRTLLQSPQKAPPLPYLHNIALARVQTSHVLILDESVWPMEDLDMSIRSAYRTSAPRLAALLLPKVLTTNTDLALNDLPDCLQEQSCRLKGLESEEWDGTSKLLPCIQSTTHFEPYLVMPWCAMLESNDISPGSKDRNLRYGRRQQQQHRERDRPYQEQLAWHDERLTAWTWRLAQTDQLRYAGLAFWLTAGFVYGPEQENPYNHADDVLWSYFHERVVDRFVEEEDGDDDDDDSLSSSSRQAIVPVCESMAL